MSSKLHELLAVENEVRGQAETCRTDLKNTFEKKPHHFTKKIVTVKSKKEGVPDKVEAQLNPADLSQAGAEVDFGEAVQVHRYREPG